MRIHRETWVLVIVLMGLLLFNQLLRAALVPSLSQPNTVKVSKSVYALIGDMDVPTPENQGFISNTTFIITDDSVVVVDPGGSKQIGEMVIAEIRKVTDKPISHVINTHHHADHWMANDAFTALSPRPQIVGHAYMRTKAKEIGEQWLGIISRLTNKANIGTKVVLPDTEIVGGRQWKMGNLTLQFYHPAHAHTKGDIAIFIPEEKVLVAGDIHFYKRTPGFQDASPLGNLAALKELKKLNPKHVIPGHGPVTDINGLQYMLTYIEKLESEVSRLFKDGLEDFEMNDKIKLGDYRNMSGFSSRFGINVNRMYAEIEARDFD